MTIKSGFSHPFNFANEEVEVVENVEQEIIKEINPEEDVNIEVDEEKLDQERDLRFKKLLQNTAIPNDKEVLISFQNNFPEYITKSKPKNESEAYDFKNSGQEGQNKLEADRELENNNNSSGGKTGCPWWSIGKIIILMFFLLK